MKTKLLLLLALVGTVVPPALAAPARVLFIGNSYTGVNNLPQIFHDIVASTGAAVPAIKAATPGGKTLAQHLNLPATVQLIDEGRWDVVVLQGQSQEAARAEQSAESRTNFLNGAAGLYDRIKVHSAHAKVVLYETWARHADYWQAAKADTTAGNNAPDMQARIRKWYRAAAAQKPEFVVAPVGDAWELHYRTPTAGRLHAKDNSHPTFNGSYLAGLVIYATIYQPANLNIRYHGDLTTTEAADLQRLAAQVTRPVMR